MRPGLRPGLVLDAFEDELDARPSLARTVIRLDMAVRLRRTVVVFMARVVIGNVLTLLCLMFFINGWIFFNQFCPCAARRKAIALGLRPRTSRMAPWRARRPRRSKAREIGPPIAGDRLFSRANWAPRRLFLPVLRRGLPRRPVSDCGDRPFLPQNRSPRRLFLPVLRRECARRPARLPFQRSPCSAGFAARFARLAPPFAF